MSRRMFATPDAAEDAFYAALAAADFNRMQAVWADSEQVICVHPMGPRLSGLQAVLSSWRDMFARGQGVVIERRTVQRIHSQSLAVHSLFEIILAEQAQRRYPPIIATNAYLLTADGWRLLLHQACPSPSAAADHVATQSDPRQGRFH